MVVITELKESEVFNFSAENPCELSGFPSKLTRQKGLFLNLTARVLVFDPEAIKNQSPFFKHFVLGGSEDYGNVTEDEDLGYENYVFLDHTKNGDREAENSVFYLALGLFEVFKSTDFAEV